MIEMGNDEFILYVRKRRGGVGVTNDTLGKRIWKWIMENDTSARQIHGRENERCLWDEDDVNVNPNMLPKTACQFRFNRNLLVRLYDFLDTL